MVAQPLTVQPLVPSSRAVMVVPKPPPVIPMSWLGQNTASNLGNGVLTSFPITLANVQAGSSCVLAFVQGAATVLGTFSVTDSAGSSWTMRVPAAQPGGYYTHGFAVCPTVAGAPGANIPLLTVNLACTTASDSGATGIWIGRSSLYILGNDQNPKNSGAVVSMTGPPFATLAGPGELILESGGNGTPAAPTAAPGAPWTNITGPALFGGILGMPIAWQVAPSTSPPAAAVWTMPTATAWVTVAAAFVLSTSGPSA